MPMSVPRTTRPRASTLAVGTEVVDGQILDRNSAWISNQLSIAGVQVIEHRAVADDRPDIERGLAELAQRTDLLFVTGGLGPTSDDFTRDLISSVFKRPLKFDQGSWDHLSALLGSRGMEAREIQKQQCYFPEGARILTNPAGTANAFSLDLDIAGRKVRLYALPGPPTEIAAIWSQHLVTEISAFTPEALRENLQILRFLGRGESQIAEVVEELLKGSDLRVGYRAHLPYVEVKLWSTPAEAAALQSVTAGLEARLGEFLVNRNEEDVADALLERALKGEAITILDYATRGILCERLNTRLMVKLAEAKSVRPGSGGGLDAFDTSIVLNINTCWSLDERAPAAGSGTTIVIKPDTALNGWRLSIQTGTQAKQEIEVKAAFHYKLLSERARRFITEKSLILLRDL